MSAVTREVNGARTTGERGSSTSATAFAGVVTPTATLTLPYLGAVVAKGEATWGVDGLGSGGVRVKVGFELGIGLVFLGWVFLGWVH